VPSTTIGSPPPSSAPSTGSANPPSSCNVIPQSIIATYIGVVATVHALGTPPQLSCEFANASASSIVIINIGRGTTSEFATLRTVSAGGGRTVTPISGLGTEAFSISKGGVVRGVNAFTAHGLLISVAANLSLTQSEALIRQLMKLP
jgi:hypothetical protein